MSIRTSADLASISKRTKPVSEAKLRRQWHTKDKQVIGKQGSLRDNDNLTEQMRDLREAEICALHVPTELYAFPLEVQELVIAAMYCGGTPVFALAACVRLKEYEFMKKFADVLRNATMIANARVEASLFNTALYEPDPKARTTAAIFWLKCRARWREDGTVASSEDKGSKTPVAQYTEEELAIINEISRRAEARVREAAENPMLLIEETASPKNIAVKSSKQSPSSKVKREGNRQTSSRS